MKIDNNTLALLKNFSSINPSLLIKPGSVLATINTSKSVFVKATVEVEFPRKFAIYDLNKFINVLSLFDDPELNITDQRIEISDANGRKVNYYHAAENMVKDVPPEKNIVMPPIKVSFKLTDKILKDVIKASYVLGLPFITISGNGADLVVSAEDVKNGSDANSTNSYSIRVGATDVTFKAIFKTENISKIISGDYEVEISDKIIRLRDLTKEYFVAVEANSTF